MTLYGETKDYAGGCGIERIHVSLSDTSSVAIAYVVAEGKGAAHGNKKFQV